ncbi:MAG: glycosyltransferase, partial [Verrucomicrobia bacterium]|nr:glycosyltransferase [Verrucomicrobiota bacterium]
VIEALNCTMYMDGFTTGRFLDTYLPLLADNGAFVLDAIDTSYNQVPDNEFATPDLHLPVAQRRPSEYRNRVGEAEVRAAFAERGLKIETVMSGGERVPRKVYIARLAPKTAAVPGAVPAAPKPRILLLADVPGWIFERHARTLAIGLQDEFDFTLGFRGQNFNEDNFDLIYPLEFDLVDTARIRDPRKYVTGIRSHCAWQRIGFEQVAEVLRAKFQRVHAVSRRLQEIFRPQLPAIELLSHGVDTEFFAPQTRADISSRGKLRIGWAGNRHSPNKGFAEFIEPLGRLPGVELVFCGYADRKLTAEEMPGFYNSIDAYVCASDFEGNNNSLLEAAAMARAIITTDNGTVPEYLRHGESAFIVEHRLDDFIRAVEQLRDDPHLRKRLGDAAHSSVKVFDWRAKAEEYRGFFRRSLAAANKPLPAPAAWLSSGDPLAEAEANAREALTLCPGAPEASRLLAGVLLQRGQWFECARACEQLLAQMPNDVEALLTLAKCFFKLGDIETTRLVLSRVLELDPANTLARENLVDLATSGASAKSSQPENKLVQPQPKPADVSPVPDQEIAIRAGMAALEKNDFAAALKHYERALALGNDSAELKNIIGQLRSLAAQPAANESAAPAVRRDSRAPVQPARSTRPVRPARVNIAMLTHNALHYTKLCIASLLKHTPQPFNIFIVDNLSSDATPQWLADQTSENLHYELSGKNLGVPGGRNRLIEFITPHLPPDGFVVFLDNDMELFEGWAEMFLEFLGNHPEVGVVSTVGHPFIIRGDKRELLAHPATRPAPVDVACGGYACWIRAATLRDVGPFDEKLGLFWHEDDDYSVRALAAGWEVFGLPGIPIVHHGHKSGHAQAGLAQDATGGSPENMKYLIAKWRAMGAVDERGRIKRPLPANRPLLPHEPQIPVRWMAPIYNPSGYASEAINFLLPLSHRLNLGAHHYTNVRSAQFEKSLHDLDLATLAQLHECFKRLTGGIVVSHNPAHGFARLPDAAWHVGRTMFETDRSAPDWVRACNQMDEVWVPSRFNVETFVNSGVERSKLRVVPGSVDSDEFDPARHEPLPLPNRAAFNFLAIFEWSSRKGWDVLLSAYLREFSAADDVCLYLRTYLFGQPDGDPREAIWQRIRAHAATLGLGDKPWPRIEILAEQVPLADLPKLYRAADCLVAPSRGEGWGRPQHEAMLMELPVIATNWSANTEFMNAENSFLLDYELVDIKQIEPELWHYHGHRWANPSEKHLRELMRFVQQHPAEAKAKGKLARAHMVKHYSRRTVAEQIVRCIAEIERILGTPSLCAAAARTIEVKAEFPGRDPQPLNVAWEGSFLDYGSLSHVNREFTRALRRQPRAQLVCVGKNTIPPQHAHEPTLIEMSRQLRPQPARNSHVTIRHAWPPDWDAPSSGLWVLMQPWEFGTLPEEWQRHAARVDEVWAYSEAVRRAYVDSGVESAKVKVVPLGIDAEKFRPDAPPLELPTRKKFKFLFVGGTIHRKGPEELAPGALPGLYTACDCLVHPYRGEGFGLPVLEAMACGLPVVVTGGGATDDFATDEFAWRIPSRRVSTGDKIGSIPLVHNGWLLEPDLESLKDILRRVTQQPDEAKARGRAASEHVRAHWTWERSAQIAAQRLQDLVARKQIADGEIRTRRELRAAKIVAPPVARLGHLGEARELLRQRQFVAAWNLATEAVRLRPFHPEAFVLLGEIALNAGDVARARRCVERAVQLAPNWKPAAKFLRSLPTRPASATTALSDASLSPLAPRPLPSLSVCLITKNEERFLGKCLASVRGIASQIVVVDTGSTDRTVEIAREHGAEIYSFKWCDDFSAARNAALERATGDWVLVLDADEELTPAARETLRREMARPGVIAYRLPMTDVGREEGGRSFVPRLFRNAPGLFYICRVHEQVFPSVVVRSQEWNLTVELGETSLLHHGYAPEVVKSRNKGARNFHLLLRAVEEMPNEPNLLMNLGLELARTGRIGDAIGYYSEAFEALSAQPAGEQPPELREALVTQLCSHLLAVKDHAAILRVMAHPLGKAAGPTASLHFIAGLASLELKQFAGGAEHFRHCVAKRGLPALTPVAREIRKAAPRHCLALCLIGLKRLAEAEEVLHAALAEDPQSRGVKTDLARLFNDRGQPLDALRLFTELVSEKSDDALVWQMGGRVALSRPDFLEFALDWTSEAVKALPGDAAISVQRAEVLLLAQRPDEALPFWSRAPMSPVNAAARVLCELAAHGRSEAPDGVPELALSGEFLKWYRRLIDYRGTAVVMKLNASNGSLARVVPSAARHLEAALSEAKRNAAATA